MPELPEVETVRRSLEPHLLGRTITAVTLARPDILTGDPNPDALLSGQRIVTTLRRGKQLALISDSGRALVIQLGMSGQVLVRPATDALPNHAHACWLTDAGLRVIFRDPRRFGGLTTYPTRNALDQAWSVLGPDALTLTHAQLAAALDSRRRPIKPALLDQSLIAGVGNIYADEALFASGIHPKALTHRLKSSRVVVLAGAIRTVLEQAVRAGGSTLRDYVDANGQSGGYLLSHAVYGRHSLPCTRCGSLLKRSTVGQRTTTHCPTCQRRGS